MRVKHRIPIHVRSRILIANRHACCICGRGGVQIHHINGDPEDNGDENLAVLCLPHHSDATAPPNLSAKLRDEEIRAYKSHWEKSCQKSALLIARSRTAFYMVDYKNPDRIRQLYSELSLNERLEAYQQLRVHLQEETKLRKEQKFDTSLEPTMEWNPVVEALVEEIRSGTAHPEVFSGTKGHPLDPLYPGMDFTTQPPAKFLYDIWCQIMIRAIVLCRGSYDIADVMPLEDPAVAGLEGKLLSFRGTLRGKVAHPGEWRDEPMSRTVLVVKKDGTSWRSVLHLKTHYVYSMTATIPLSHGSENGLLFLRGIDGIKKRSGGSRVVSFASTPLIIGSGELAIPPVTS